MADIRRLNRILKRIDHILTFVKEIGLEETLEDVQALLREEWADFKEFETNAKLNPDASDLMDQIETKYFLTRGSLLKLEFELKEHDSKGDKGNCTMEELVLNQRSFLEEITHANKRSNDADIKLPRVNIPSFSGVYSEFPSFRDLFEATIEKNKNISKVQKLQYLKCLLKGDAAALIRHVTTTDANYDEAWEMIKNRYDKKRQIVSNLIKQFMDQPSISQPTAKALHHMSDTSDEVLRGLKVLGPQAESRDPWILSILLTKLDAETRQAWAHETADEDFPEIPNFFQFLNKRSDALETCDVTKRSSTNKKPSSTNIRVMQATSSNIICPKCSQGHYLNLCDKYLELSVCDRKGFVAANKLCFICLHPRHQANTCRSRHRCAICRLKHNTSLHEDNTENKSLSATIINNEADSLPENTHNQTSETLGMHVNTEPNMPNETIKAITLFSLKHQALLPTAIVRICDSNGKQQKCRVLLDSGAQASFISESCVQRLGLKRKNANISIKGLVPGKSQTKGITTLSISSCYNSEQIIISALILNKLPTTLPSQPFTIKDSSYIRNLQLADPDFNTPYIIDVIIGADRFFSVLRDGRIEKNGESLVAQNTIFGWILSGDLSLSGFVTQPEANITISNFFVDFNIDETLRRFWELEEVPSINPWTPEEIQCEEHFKSNFKRSDSNKFIVKIPFKASSPTLGNSSSIAIKRFMH